MGCNKRSSKREVFSNTNQPQEIRKTSNKGPNLTPKASRERRIKQKAKHNTKVSRRREIIQIREEISKAEIKKAIAKIKETKSWFFEKIKLINLQPDSSTKTGRVFKPIKLEMKKQSLNNRNHRNTKAYKTPLQGTIWQ